MRAPRDAHELTLTTSSVVIFKDGYAMLSKRAVGIADERGDVVTREVPGSAILGCFWAIAPDGTPVRLVAEWVERDVVGPGVRDAASMGELLMANVGKRCTLSVLEPSSGGPRSLVCTIERVLGGDLVAVTREDGVREVFSIATIRAVSGDGIALDVASPPGKERVKVLRASLGKAHAGERVELRIFYFALGIRWIPTYRLYGPSEASAPLTLTGEVVNELEDIAGARVGLVAGVPNFRFKDEVSSLSLEATLRSVLPEDAVHTRSRGEARRLVSQQLLSNAATFEELGQASTDGGLDTEIAGQDAQDLFVYDAGVMDLPKGARASIPLWQVSTTPRHVYTLEVIGGPADPRALEQWRRTREEANGGDLMAKIRDGRVWHQIELENTSAGPWTTGAALVVQGDLPVGQDILVYTPKGGSVRVPLTVVADVRSQYNEAEVARAQGAVTWNSTTYAKLRKKGTLALTNYHEHPVTIEAKVSVIGGVPEVANAGARVGVADLEWFGWHDEQRALNPRSTLTWSLTLTPGEEKMLTFEYEVYVR